MTENPTDIIKIKVLGDISKELDFAISKFRPFHSYHEGFAIIQEEFHELFMEIIKHKEATNKIRGSNDKNIKKEAIQLAAMTVRLIMDCCEV